MITFIQHVPAFLVPFFSLSYPTNTPEKLDSFYTATYYTTGPLDACFIVSCIAIMAILRDAIRLGILEPFARWKLTGDLTGGLTERARKKTDVSTNGHSLSNGHGANGHSAHVPRRESRRMHRSVLRFAEQGWPVLYYAVQWAYGVYVYCNLPTQILNPLELWLNYPHFPIAGPVKFYYLTQFAFYLHQVLILNAEAPRKDHIQMMTHHVITILLMAWSYFYNFTRAGCLIIVIMDYCDIFLPLAKMFRYLSLNKLCDATFVWFLLSWLVTRHGLFLVVIKSVYTDLPKYTNLEWAPERGRYISYEIWLGYVGMLVALQILQVIWFWMICRVAWRVVSGANASDDRSDDESGAESDEKKRG